MNVNKPAAVLAMTMSAVAASAVVAFGNPANASAANQNKPSVQNAGQQCNPWKTEYLLNISAGNGETQFQKVTLPACKTPPQITLRIPDTSTTVRYSPSKEPANASAANQNQPAATKPTPEQCAPISNMSPAKVLNLSGQSDQSVFGKVLSQETRGCSVPSAMKYNELNTAMAGQYNAGLIRGTFIGISVGGG